MARRTENECAFCAEEIVTERGIVGKDWKVYCGKGCAESGEAMSLEEWRNLMRAAQAKNNLFVQERAA